MCYLTDKVGKPTPAQISAWEQSHGKKPVSKPTKPEIAAAAAGRTVVYAFAADMSGITDNLAWSSSWQAKGNSNTTTGKDSSLQYWQTSSVSGPPKTIEATLIVDGQHKDDAMTFTQSLVRPFAYSSTPNPSNTTNPSMWVFAQAAVQAYASSGGAPAGYSPVPVSINTGLQFPGSATMSGSALSLNNPSDSDPPVRSS